MGGNRNGPGLSAGRDPIGEEFCRKAEPGLQKLESTGDQEQDPAAKTDGSVAVTTELLLIVMGAGHILLTIM